MMDGLGVDSRKLSLPDLFLCIMTTTQSRSNLMLEILGDRCDLVVKSRTPAIAIEFIMLGIPSEEHYHRYHCIVAPIHHPSHRPQYALIKSLKGPSTSSATAATRRLIGLMQQGVSDALCYQGNFTNKKYKRVTMFASDCEDFDGKKWTTN